MNATIKYMVDKIITPSLKIRLLGIKCTNLMKLDEWKRKTLQAYFLKPK